jgi:hypothetical protein
MYYLLKSKEIAKKIDTNSYWVGILIVNSTTGSSSYLVSTIVLRVFYYSSRVYLLIYVYW